MGVKGLPRLSRSSPGRTVVGYVITRITRYLLDLTTQLETVTVTDNSSALEVFSPRQSDHMIHSYSLLFIAFVLLEK